MALSNLHLLTQQDYFAQLYDMIKQRENPWLYAGTGYQRIHDGGGDGNPTFGYGFNLAAFSAFVVEEAIIYAFGGSLAPQQSAGLDIVLAWKTGAPLNVFGQNITLKNSDIINMADVSLNGSPSAFGESSQRSAVQSLFLTDIEGTRLLDVAIKGVLGLVHIEGPPGTYGYEGGLDYRLSQEGGMPYSVERVALLSVYYNAPALIGPGVQNEILNDNRAKLWYEIRYNHNNFDHTGLQNRRAEEADLLGLVSRSAKNNPDANLDEYVLAAHTIFNEFDRLDRRIYTRIINRDDKDPLFTTIAPELDVLDEYFARAPLDNPAAPLIDFVQADLLGVSAPVFASDDDAAGIAGGKNWTNTVNLIHGYGGDDFIEGYGATDYLYGGAGDDTLIGDGSGLLAAEAGNDLLHGGPGYDIVDYTNEDGPVNSGLSGVFAGVASTGEEYITITDTYGKQDRLISIEEILLSSNIDTVDLSGLSSGVWLDGRAGDDVLTGGQNADVLRGGVGNDVLSGGAGPDTLAGNSGNDLLNGGSGSDKIFSNGGDDTAYGGAGDDTLVGSGGNDSLTGGDGNDKIYGNGGNDILAGKAGDDLLLGLPGNDSIAGNIGDDTLKGGDGEDKLFGNGGADLIYGEDDRDTLVGSGGDDTLDGGTGDDLLLGNGNNDALSGGDGNDKMLGLWGNDSLNGGAGADILNGGTGDDALTGGADADRFVFRPNEGADIITDFSSGSGDVIVLQGFGAIFDDFSDLLPALSQSGADTFLDLGGGASILIVGVTPSQLSAGDFLFS